MRETEHLLTFTHTCVHVRLHLVLVVGVCIGHFQVSGVSFRHETKNPTGFKIALLTMKQ